MRTTLVVFGITFATAAVGCSLGLSPRPNVKDTAGHRAPVADVSIVVPPAPDPPRELAGVDTWGLEGARKQSFWDVANRLYAPCTEHAVTLVQCIEQKRSCD